MKNKTEKETTSRDSELESAEMTITNPTEVERIMMDAQTLRATSLTALSMQEKNITNIVKEVERQMRKRAGKGKTKFAFDKNEYNTSVNNYLTILFANKGFAVKSKSDKIKISW